MSTGERGVREGGQGEDMDCRMRTLLVVSFGSAGVGNEIARLASRSSVWFGRGGEQRALVRRGFMGRH